MSPLPPSSMDADSDSELSTILVATPSPASATLAAATEANLPPSNSPMSRSQIQEDKQAHNQQLREQSLRRPSSSLRIDLADQTLPRQPPSNGFSAIRTPSAQTFSAQPHSSQKGPVILLSETPSPPANPSQKLSSEAPSHDDGASSYVPTPPPRPKKSKSESTKVANKKRSKKGSTKSSQKSSKTTNKKPNQQATPTTTTPPPSMPPDTAPDDPPKPSTLPAWSSGGAPTASDTAAMALLNAAATPLTAFLHRYTRLIVFFPSQPDRHPVTLTPDDSPATGFAADAVAKEIDLALGGELEWARLEGEGAGEREELVRRAVREGLVVVVGSGGGEEDCVVRRDEEGGIGIELGDVREDGDAEGET